MQEDPISRAIRLALLEKNDTERDALRADVERILEYTAAVRELSADAENGDPRKVNVFREDAVTVPAGMYREHMLAQAPKHFRQWFLSKKILP